MTEQHFSVHDQDGYERVYDEDEEVTIRRGDLRALLDVATGSMDFGSGFLDNEQVEVLRKVAEVLGVEPKVVTPSNFVCQYEGKHNWNPVPEWWQSRDRTVTHHCTFCSATTSDPSQNAAPQSPDGLGKGR